MATFRKTLLLRGSSVEDLNAMTAEELVQYNPKLVDYTPTTRLAYAKFKTLGKKTLFFNGTFVCPTNYLLPILKV